MRTGRRRSLPGAPSAVRCGRAGIPYLPVQLAAAAALLSALAAALPAAAHQRSQSYSTWHVDGEAVRAIWSVTAFEATRLPAESVSQDALGRALADHLADTVSLRRGGAPCSASAPPRVLRARPGHLRVELAFGCPGAGPLELTSHAFLELAPSHLHFARVVPAEGSTGEPAVERVFDAARPTQPLQDGAARREGTGSGAGFSRYVALGTEHILIGYDHLAFLLSLILLGGGLRELVGVVTGFTLGHSVTLSLAALGWVQVDGSLVEALIGFSIALVAAENLAVRGGVHVALARGAAVVLALLAGLAAAGWPPGSPPWVTLAGLALFSACYLRLAATPGASRRFRPAITLLFGLVHGFGFASVLAEIGLPKERLLAGLFGFNLGVELGQLAVVLAIAALGGLARALVAAAPRGLAVDALSAALCALGLFWFAIRAYG